MLLPTSLDALLSPSAMKLAMGEMSREELVAAQKAVREVLESLGDSGWSVGDRQPPMGLLQSMAVRLDHGLGLPGYYDQFGMPPGTHAQKLEKAIDLARDTHTSFVRHAPAFPSGLIDALQGKHARTELSKADPVRLTVDAAIRYAVTSADRYGLVLLPQELKPDLVSKVLQDVPLERWVSPASIETTPVEEFRESISKDVGRFYEETVGTGFCNPAWSLEGLSRPRRPKP